ncbi:MAG: serine/threonine protein kinase [Phycisphaerae bacterium]|nr:serine/threonine protein kinase [Gemmatimonadaceae bacterium]
MMSEDLTAALQTALGSAYTIERELGGGGMSRVFVARDHGLSRQVVVKLLPPSMAERVSIERFKREILMLAGLQHPHIVPILSAADCEGLPYFIMPFVQGESLRARLLRGPMSVREAVGIMRDVARALMYAHEQGVVHRDVKPDNILLAGGSATVTDFGVAKAFAVAARRSPESGPVPSSITETGISLGTPIYMAPEQVAADPNIDFRADLYSLGIVAYEMLIGTPPFHGRTRQAVMTAQLTERPPEVNHRRGDVSEALSKLIAQCLEKDAANRPRSSAQFARALDEPEILAPVHMN